MRSWMIWGAVLALSTMPVLAQSPQLTCRAESNPLPVRAGGLSELVGDIVLRCTGGEPTPPGQAPPTANISVRTNTPISNGVGDAAFLFLDDPESFVVSTGAPSGPPVNPGDVPNVFQGTRQSDNTIVWLGVPINAPGSVGQRIFRVKNIRASVAGASAPNGQVTGFLSFQNGPANLQLLSDSVNVAILQSALSSASADPNATQVLGAQIFRPSVELNPNVPASTPSAFSFNLRYVEAYASAFKTRTSAQGTVSNPFPPPAAQDDVTSSNAGSETGLYSPQIPGSSPASFGTRLSALFANVPPGVRLYVTSTNANSSQDRAIAIADCVGSSVPAPATNGLVEVPINNGTGGVCFEVFQSNPLQVSTLIFPVVMNSGGFDSGLVAGTGGIFASLQLAPVAPVASNRHAESLPVPIFEAPADRFDLSRQVFVAAQFRDPAETNTFQQQRDPTLANRDFEPSTFDPVQGFNLYLYSTASPLSVTVEPRVDTFSGAARQVTNRWLSVIPSQPGTPLTMTVEVDSRELPPGTYTGGVRISAPPPANLLNEIPIRMIVPPANAPAFPPNGVVGAADYYPGVVTPGQAIVVFGTRMGPANLAGLQLDAQGRVATTLADTRILFDGVPAPLIYTQEGQASAFVPFAVAGRSFTEMRVEYRGVRSPPLFLRVIPSLPSLFTADTSGSGQGAILNQDGSVNNAANPAQPGDVIVVYGTGGGQTNPPGVDGAVIGAPLPQLTQPVTAFIDGQPAEVVYAGPAPGLAAGVLQANLRIPANAQRGQAVSIELVVGDSRSQAGVTVAIAP